MLTALLVQTSGAWNQRKASAQLVLALPQLPVPQTISDGYSTKVASSPHSQHKGSHTNTAVGTTTRVHSATYMKIKFSIQSEVFSTLSRPQVHRTYFSSLAFGIQEQQHKSSSQIMDSCPSKASCCAKG